MMEEFIYLYRYDLMLALVIIIFIYWIYELKIEINKRKAIQKKLEISDEKYRTLFELAPILLDSFDEQGKIILWNKECEKVFGYTKEEIFNHNNPISLFYEDNYNNFSNLVKNSSEDEITFVEWKPKRKDGKKLVVKWANISLLNGEMVHIGVDITEQRENEQLLEQQAITLAFAKNQLEKLNDSLEERIKTEIEKSTHQQALLMQQSKLAQMGEMIQNIAHQWRQPLVEINSNLMLIDYYVNDKNAMSDEIEERISSIENITKYLSNTISSFQDFFHPNKEKSSFSLDEVIDKTYNIVKVNLLKNDILFKKVFDKNLECFGQKEELQQVFLVLINNSIQAIEKYKIVNPKIIIKAYIEDNFTIIEVKDNALGIDEKDLPKVFDPYFTTKHKSQGVGVGLYMAKMIIEKGFLGELLVSNISNGACFTVKLPR